MDRSLAAPVSGAASVWRVLRDPAAWLVVGVAAGLRVLYLLDIRDNPFFHHPVIDAAFYLEQARALAAGHGTGAAPFMMPPGWPLLLAGVLRLGGPDLVVAHAFQGLLGTLTALVAYGLGCRLGGRVVGVTAGMVVASSKALWFVEGDLLATPLVVFLQLGALAMLVRWIQDRQRRDLVLSGLTYGLAVLARPSIAVVLVVLLPWIAWGRLRQPRAAVALAVLGVLPVLPVAVHNWQAAGEFVPVSANGGINFYIGNNPNAVETEALRPGPAYRRLNDLPLREAGIARPAARDAWFYRAGLRYWREQPLDAVRHWGRKTLLLVHNHEIMRDYDYYAFAADWSRLLRLPWWNFATLFALAVVGGFFRRRPGPAWRAVAIQAWTYGMGITLFFVAARYRAPWIPILGLYAGCGVAVLVEVVRARAWKRGAAVLATAAAAYTLSVVDFFGVDRVDRAEAQYRYATAVEKSGDCARAIALYDAVLQQRPDHALAGARAAVCAQRLGRLQEAVDRYEAVLERHPDYVEPMLNLAQLAWRHGDPQTARHYFELALRTDPYFARSFGLYGQFLVEKGSLEAGIAALRRALELDPGWQALRVDLAEGLLRARRAGDALREIETAWRRGLRSARAALVYGDALAAAGRVEEARAAYAEGLRLDPADAALQQRYRRVP